MFTRKKDIIVLQTDKTVAEAEKLKQDTERSIPNSIVIVVPNDVAIRKL